MNDVTASPVSAERFTDSAARPTAMDQLMQDVHHFLADWLQRLDDEVKNLQPASTSESISQARLDEFEQLKRQWEAHRNHEVQLMREQSDHLTAAWLQLEAEQRRFLQIKQEPQNPASSVPAHRQLPRQPKPVASPIPARDAAVRQFRQLQQEIGAAAPPSNTH